MLDTKNIVKAQNFLIRELNRYGGVNDISAYEKVKRDIDACEDDGTRAKDFWNIILDELKADHCGG